MSSISGDGVGHTILSADTSRQQRVESRVLNQLRSKSKSPRSGGSELLGCQRTSLSFGLFCILSV